MQVKGLGRSFLVHVWIAVGFLGAPAWATVDGTISGVVSASGKEGVELTVRLKNLSGGEVTEVKAQSGQEYQFFPVKLGDYELTVCFQGNCSEPQQVHVASGSDLHENLTWEIAASPAALPSPEPSSAEGMVVNVRAKKKLVQNISTGTQYELNQSEVKKLPQGSEASLPKLIASTTAGVVPGSFGQLYFRGNHATIQYQLDGIQMPESPSSSFGQTFSPRNIDRMEVITGGIPAEFGQRLSAVVNVVTKSGPEKPEGELELNYGSYNTFSPHLIYGGSNQRGDFKYFFSLNYNQTDRGIDTPNPQSLDLAGQRQGGTESVHNHSVGNSEFAKLDWQVANTDKLSLVLNHSYNFFQIPNYPTSFDPRTNAFARSGYFSTDTNYVDAFGNSPESHQHGNHVHLSPIYVYSPGKDTQAERNAYAQFVWKHTVDSRSYFQLAPYYKYSSIVNTADPTTSGDFYTVADIPAANPVAFSQNRHSNSLGLKGDYSIRLQDDHLLKTGFQLQRTEVAGFYQFQTSNGFNFGNQDPSSANFESLYLQDDFTLHRQKGTVARHLVLNAGIRFDATQFSFSGDRPTDYQFQPRIGLNYMLDESTRFHAFYGRLFQPAPIENLRVAFQALHPSDSVVYDIKAEKSNYYELGVSRQIFGQNVVGANVFYKEGVNFLDAGQLLRTPIAQPFNFAQGYAYGAELSFKGQINHDWSHYLNYSYLIAKAKGISGGVFANDHGPSDAWQNMDHSQTHTANAGLTYSKKGFWWTTQAMFGSGLWTGESNSIRLPSHLTFDTTVGYDFSEKFSGLGKWKVSLDLLNILDNRYPITIANTFNGSRYAAGRQVFLRISRAF